MRDSGIRLGLGLLVLSIGCGVPPKKIAIQSSALKQSPTVLVIVRDRHKGPAIDFSGVGAFASGFAGGLVGGGIYAAVQHKKNKPLREKLETCRFTSRFSEDLVKAVSLRPNWKVVTSSATDAAEEERMADFLFDDKGNNEERQAARRKLKDSGIDYALLVDLAFYGVRKKEGKGTYDIVAESTLRDPQLDGGELWKEPTSAAIEPPEIAVTLESEVSKSNEQVCAQLAQQGQRVSHAIAIGVGVPATSLADTPNPSK